MAEKRTLEWINNRQRIAWEPEILITGVVLIGLLQIPDLLHDFNLYLNDWGPAIFYTSGMDEFLLAFLNTSVLFLIAGLIITLLMRSVWVVMIGMSYLFPHGVDIEKFRFQEFYQNKLRKAVQFDDSVVQLDRLCSLIYSLTFFLFMCIIGTVFCTSVVAAVLMVFYHIFPVSSEINLILNLAINILFNLMVVLYLLDFLTLGWFKRFSRFSKVYKPVYIVMSFLTLAPLYRNIYYAILSRFNRWKVFAGLAFFLAMIFLVLSVERGKDSPLDILEDSRFVLSEQSILVTDGFYRDKNPAEINSWLHISSATVKMDVLEVFVSHKKALESSILESFSVEKGLAKEKILSSDSLRLAALSHFYRFKIDNKEIDQVPFTQMKYTQYNQRGMLGFIPLDSVSQGSHSLELYLNNEDETKVAEIIFYKVNE